MIRAVAVGILRQVLLVIVGAETGNPTDAPELDLLASLLGRLPVDLSVVPRVDQR